MAHTNSSLPKGRTETLKFTIHQLLGASIAKSTKSGYKIAYEKYSSFIGKSHDIIPISVSNLSSFIAHLHLQGFKASSIRSTVAGLSYFHVMLNLLDPAKHSIIKSLLKGSSKLCDSPDIRLPITREILNSMLDVIERIIPSSYDRILYRSMLTLAFHALLRIGEFTVRGNMSNHTLKVQNIKFIQCARKPVELQVTIPHFKHSKRPVTLSLQVNVSSRFCPVRLLSLYLKARQSGKSDILFVNQSGTPISSYRFTRVFRDCITDLGLNASTYKPHSLRIGGATLAHECNYSESQIASLGRWSSQSYKRYIRVPLIPALS